MAIATNLKKTLVLIFFFFLLSFSSSHAHCDSVNGPVVMAAKKTLETGNLNYVFIWINPEDEKEITDLYEKIMKVRDLNGDVRVLVDTYFYETVVRVHRMSEGVGYTGLKFEDFDPSEGIKAADKAIEMNSVDELLVHLSDEVQTERVKHSFTDLQTKRNFDIDDVNAGREYVAAYVHFIHFVEELFEGGVNEHNHNETHKH
ncbi:MAG: DUF6448 family protein [Melioribacteraceae bacterium]|nr:DUF6448 family protein [Melioribacteraceae bacterium]